MKRFTDEELAAENRLCGWILVVGLWLLMIAAIAVTRF